MKRIDELIMKATKIRPYYEDIFIISNETGIWMVDGKEFPTFEAAEEYVYRGSVDPEEILVIINDAGLCKEPERKQCECGKDQVENKEPDRGAPDAYQGHEHGGQRRNGQQDSKYYHSWV